MKNIMKCLSGRPNQDVPALCLALGQIAKAVNPNLEADAFTGAFGNFWATVYAYPDTPPVTGLEFMQQVLPDGTRTAVSTFIQVEREEK